MSRQLVKKSTLLLLILCLFAFAAIGCGKTNDTKKGDNSSKSGGTTKILFWSPFSGADGPFMSKMVDKYNASQDNNKVEFVIHPSGEYYKQLDIALSTTSERPDLMIMHVDNIPTYVSKDQLQPLDSIATSANVNKADYAAAPVEYSTIDGKWYGIPLDIHPLIMYYNKDLFSQAGINNPPTNRAEFEAAIEKLTDKDKGVYGYVLPTLWPQQFLFPSLVWQNGGQLWDGKDVAYNSPEAVEMVQWMRSLVDKGYSPGNVQQDGENTLFLQGKNAIQFNGPWMKGQFEEAGLNYGVAPIPQIGKAKQAVFAGSHCFVIPKSVTDEKVLSGVADFLKFVSENSMDWAESGQALAANPMLERDDYKKLDMQSKITESFPYVQFAPNVLNWGTISEPIWGELNDALLGNKDPQKAMDDAAAKSRQAMNQ